VTATIINGAWIAQEIREEVAAGVQALQRDHGVTPGLAAVLIGDNPASASYVRGKEKACSEVGIFTETFHLALDTSQDDVLDLVRRLNDDHRFHGILTQLPFPALIDEALVVRSLHTAKDVDGLHPYNMGLLTLGEPVFICATPSGVQQLLLRTGNDPAGKHVVVCGRSNIVGKPLAMLLSQKRSGANATVTLCHTGTPDLAEHTRRADILVAAIGSPGVITADMVKPGAVVIDVGINRVEDATRKRGYRLEGDVDFDAVAEVASAITPVPGGVGPMTIAMLLVNTLTAARIHAGVGPA
jgi:methylenetetrahydrofolate dehydrogenase (NADP+)/methenyltetrahydrofolate cyclohydrolase